MGRLGRFVPRFLRVRVLDLKPRVDELEGSVRSLYAVVDALVRNPTYVARDDVGFNGQLKRKQLFMDITNAVPMEAIVETGTWLGNTAAYMAETTALPVYSCEINSLFHGVAKSRLAEIPDVHLSLIDSPHFLREISGPLHGKTVFFYLDAHWYGDVLAKEFEWIASHWDRYVVMVDDFAIPDDPGYEHDVYGPSLPLGLGVFDASLRIHDIATFYPSAPSSEETGRRRGCLVLAPRGNISDALARLPSLRAT